MSNSKLVTYTKISPNKTLNRKYPITKITIHHMAGNLSIETCGRVFEPKSRKASSNYGIGTDGRIGMYVEEKDRAWTSSNPDNDHRAVTIEVANDEIGGNWHVSDKALAALIDLCVDICQRNGIEKLNFTGDKSGNLTMHKWFAATNCPGPYLESKFPYIAEEVNKRLNAAEKAPTPADVSDIAVGDIVTFTGTKHYTSANATTGKTCKAGKAKVTAIYKTGKHPYHLVNVSGGGSTVYGWVNAADIQKTETKIKVGSVVMVKKDARTYTGGKLASFVYTRKHTVKQISGDRVVITYGGTVVAAVKMADLTLA